MNYLQIDSSNMLDIYNRMLAVCNNNDAFFYSDQVFGTTLYRVFLYRIASYGDWQSDEVTREMRGIMFEMDRSLQPVRLAARPMHKFWNLNENPFTMDLDLNIDNIESAQIKRDGSLISTFLHDGVVQVKSKGSLHSQQAEDARKWLENNLAVKDFLQNVTALGCTVDMEWTSPDNRVVIGYPDERLTVLTVRNNFTGAYLYPGGMEPPHFLDIFEQPFVRDGNELVASLLTEKEIEGYVIRLKTGQWIKIKSPHYLSLHKAKDDIASPKKMCAVILNEAVDDVRALFASDVVVVKIIDQMTELVTRVYNGIIGNVERYVAANKHLERKEFAIQTQEQLPVIFSLCMSKYLGKEPEYKKYVEKNFDKLFPDLSFFKMTGVSM